MARRDRIEGPSHHADKVEKEEPNWYQEADKVVSEWGSGKYLRAVLAEALAEAYRKGKGGEDPPPVKEPEVAPVMRVSRTKPALVRVSETTTRVHRRTRA